MKKILTFLERRAPLFLGLFLILAAAGLISGMWLPGNNGISRYLTTSSGVAAGGLLMSEEFPESELAASGNKLVLLFTNDEGDKATALATELKLSENRITDATGYALSVGVPLKASELGIVFENRAVTVDARLIRLLYYAHYTMGTEAERASLSELSDFCAESSNLRILGLSEDALSGLRSIASDGGPDAACRAATLAAMLSLDEELTTKSLLLYLSRYDEEYAGEMTLGEFADELSELSGSDPFFGLSDDSRLKSRIDTIEKYSDDERMEKQRSRAELASMLEISSDIVDDAFEKAAGEGHRSNTMSCEEMLAMMLNNMSPFLKADTIRRLQMYQSIHTAAKNDTGYDAEALAGILDLDEISVRSVMLNKEYREGKTEEWAASPESFAAFVREVLLNDTKHASAFPEDTAERMSKLQTLMDGVLSGESYDADGLSAFLGAERGDMALLLLACAASKDYDDSWQLSVWDLLTDMEGPVTSDERLAAMDEAQRTEILNCLNTLIEDSVAEYVGPHYSRIVLTADLPGDEEERAQYTAMLLKRCDEQLSKRHFLLGDAVAACRSVSVRFVVFRVIFFAALAGALLSVLSMVAKVRRRTPKNNILPKSDKYI